VLCLIFSYRTKGYCISYNYRGAVILNNALKINKEKGCHEALRRSGRQRTLSKRVYDAVTSTPKLARRVCHFSVSYVELLRIILLLQLLHPLCYKCFQAHKNHNSDQCFCVVCRCLRQKKGKVFPYSLPSVGPGADPGVQAVSPQVT